MITLDEHSRMSRLAAKAVELGADALEIEYKDGCEEVFAFDESRGAGFGIASLSTKEPEAVALREELYAMVKRRHIVVLGGVRYKLFVEVYDSFNEDAFHVRLQRIP